MLRKVLLACGIASSVVYVGATILGAMQWPGYDWTSLSISELFALDAPSRLLVAAAFLAYGPLVIAFGVGVWMSAGAKRGLRAAGGALIGYGALGWPGPVFFALPTMRRGVQDTPSDMMQVVLHLTATILLVLFLLASIALGATAFGFRFRLYSIATFVAIVVFGGLAGAQTQAIAQNLPTPWLGIEERINIFGAMLWIALLAAGLLRLALGAGAVGRGRTVSGRRSVLQPKT